MPLIPLKLGEKLKPIAVERFKMEADQKSVIAVLSVKIHGIQQHFHQNTGYFYCFGGECCKQLGLAGLRYIVPVLVYTVEKFPSKYGLPFTVQYLAAGREAYTDLLTKQEILEAQDPASALNYVDMACTCTDSQYQKIKFDVLGPNRWRKSPEVQKLVNQEYQNYQKLIELSVARTMEEDRLLELLAEVPDQGNRSQDKDKKRRPALQSGAQKTTESGSISEELETLPEGRALDPATGLDLGQPTGDLGEREINASFNDLLDDTPEANEALEKAKEAMATVVAEKPNQTAEPVSAAEEL